MSKAKGPEAPQVGVGDRVRRRGFPGEGEVIDANGGWITVKWEEPWGSRTGVCFVGELERVEP